jgi:hypothetical protein
MPLMLFNRNASRLSEAYRDYMLSHIKLYNLQQIFLTRKGVESGVKCKKSAVGGPDPV